MLGESNEKEWSGVNCVGNIDDPSEMGSRRREGGRGGGRGRPLEISPAGLV